MQLLLIILLPLFYIRAALLDAGVYNVKNPIVSSFPSRWFLGEDKTPDNVIMNGWAGYIFGNANLNTLVHT